MAGRKLQIEILGDASSLKKAFGQAHDSSSKFGKGLQSLGKVATVGVGAAFVGLAATLKVGFGELAEGQKVAAQTGAVLKSTGGAAGVTAKQVEGLAGSLSRMSGVDDEAIQSGQNLLLTFTNLHNEAGKGNDIFNQATKTMLDMSVALGTDASGSAIQLGKALNDPVKGITALTRVGVSFTEGQKASIKAMVDAGDTIGAQKVILAELTKEFGGSAKAAGDTFPGQLSKLRNAFEEVAASVASTLLPHLTRLAEWANEHMPQIQAVLQAGVGAIATAIDGIASAVNASMGPLGAFKSWLEENPQLAKMAAGAILGLAAALAVATVAQTAFNIAALMNPWVLAVAGAAALTGALVALYVTNERVHESVNSFFADLRTVTLRSLEVARGAWERFGGAITAIVVAFVKTVTIPFQNAYDVITGTFRAFSAAFRGDWSALGKALVQIIDAFGGNLVKAVLAQAGVVLTAAMAVGRAVVDGIRAGVEGAWDSLTSWIGEKMSQLKDAITHPWKLGSPSKVTIEIGKQLAEGLGIGFGLGMVKVGEEVATKIQTAIDKMISAVQAKQGAFGAAFESLVTAALAAFDKLHAGFKTAAEKALEAFDLKQATAAAKAQIDELKGALLVAQTELQGIQARGPEAVTRTEGETDEAFHARQLAAQSTFLAAEAQAQATAAQAFLALEAEKESQRLAAQRAGLEKRAEASRVKEDEQTERERTSLEARLGELQRNFLQGEITTQTFTTRLKAILDKANIPLKNAALRFGRALAAGLNEAFADVQNAARALAREIENAIGNISIHVSVGVSRSDAPDQRAAGGPVRRGAPYVVGESGPELFVPGAAGRIVANNRLSPAMAGGGGTVVNQHFHIAGSVISENQLFELVQQKAFQWKRRNAGSPFP